jgi:hypothetical protein
MATLDNDDLKAIKGLIEVTFEEKLGEKLDEKLSYLPTKDGWGYDRAKSYPRGTAFAEQQTF